MRKTFLLVTCCLLLSACASMFNSGQQAIRISGSQNEAAQVEVQGPHIFPYKTTLPHVVYVSPSSYREVQITVTDPCYSPQVQMVDRSVAGIYWANFLNIHGFYIDYFSGKMWNYDSDVRLSLKRKQQQEGDCAQSTAQVVAKPPIQYVPRRRDNMFGVGLLSNVYDKELDGIGLYLEYTRKLSSELMLNLRYHLIYTFDDSLGHDYEHGLDCFGCRYDLSTRQRAYSLSLRHFIMPTSGIYTGLGAAHIRVNQSYKSVLLDGVEKVGSHYDTGSLFAELGWVARVGHVSFNINGTLDFVDLHLASPNQLVAEDRSARISSPLYRSKARDALEAAGRNTNISMGISYLF